MPSQEYKALLDEAWDLHVRKNAGYAGADNPDPWANFRMCEAFGISAFDGCMVRLSDKYIRITNLMRSRENDQVGESIRDTLQDLAAYALISICLLDEQTQKEADVREVIRRVQSRGVDRISLQTAAEMLDVTLPDLAHGPAEARHEQLEWTPVAMDDTTPWCDLPIAPGLNCERKQGHRGTCYHS